MARNQESRIRRLESAHTLSQGNEGRYGVLTFSQLTIWKKQNPEGKGAFLIVPGVMTEQEWKNASAEWFKHDLPMAVEHFLSGPEADAPVEITQLDGVQEIEPELNYEIEPASRVKPRPEYKPKPKKPSLSPLAMEKARQRDQKRWRQSERQWREFGV